VKSIGSFGEGEKNMFRNYAGVKMVISDIYARATSPDGIS
jgi:hypothetical protein